MSDIPETSAPQPTQEEPAPRASQQRKRQRSVVFYIAILFAAAFFLLLLTFMMERRQNAENLDDLNQSLTGLKDSVSAMQSVQQLYEENTALLEQVDQLEDRLAILEQEQKTLTENTQILSQEKEILTKQTQAMDWFWQINEAYVRGRRNTARDLIEQLQEAGLEEYLPTVSVTDNGRFSPAERYLEICGDLF